MPTTYNGIGTHYYGKKNLEKETAQCEFCNNFGELHTYETGLYFVLLYIPVLPLGRKQILNYCPACTQHRVMPLREWQEAKEKAIESSTEQLAERMDDPDAAVEHLHTLTAFRQWEDARQLAPAIEKTHESDIDVMLLLGAWHDQYGNSEDADRCYDRAYELDPENPGAKRARAVGLMQQQRLEEAQEMLQEFQRPSEHYDPMLFYLLGTHFQQANRHAEALEIFDRIAEENPELAKSDELRQAALISEKAAGLKSAYITQPWFFQQPWFVTTIAVIVVVGFLFWAFFV